MSEQIRVALRDFGFMYLKNSGQMEAIAELRAAALEFFAQPEDAKVAAAAGQPGAVRGYYSERSLNTYKATGREGPPDYCSQFFMVIARTSSLPSPSPTFVPALAPSPLTHTHTLMAHLPAAYVLRFSPLPHGPENCWRCYLSGRRRHRKPLSFARV